MFRFQWPWMLLILLLPAIAWLRNRNQQQRDLDQAERQVTLLHPALDNLQSAFQGHKPAVTTSSLVYTLLLSILWIGLTLTMMRPQWLQPFTEARQEGYDLMLAVDASRSMEALDFTVRGKQVSRMQVVKGVMSKFIAGRENDRVGLIVFGSQAFTLSPLTLDRDAVRSLLDDVVPRIAGDGTAIGDALGLGVKKLRPRPEGSRVLMLIADGENTAGTIPPIQAAQLAAREGIRIYSIGVGSDLEEVPVMENGRLVYKSDYGFDEEIMRQIALITGGAYFRATDTSALEVIYQKIDELEKSKAESRTVMVPSPLYRWPLSLALLALMLLGLFPNAQPRSLRLKSVNND